MTPKLTIVTVTYNSSAVVGNMLKSIDMPEVPVVLVDNGSRDNTIDIASAYPNVQVIKSQNIGYGSGANRGFRAANTPYVLLVNPDAVFIPGAIAEMLKIMEVHPEIGMIGPRIFSIEHGGKDYGKTQSFNAEGLHYTDWIVGALMFIRTEALEKVGMFDEEIFLFYEETDLCKRFVKAGHSIAVTNKAEVQHDAGNSSAPSMRVIKIKAWHSAWSKAYYYRKHFSQGKYLKKCISKLLTNSIRCVRSVILGNKDALTKNIYEMKGVFAYMRGQKSFENGVGRFT